MKLVTYATGDGASQLGMLRGDQVHAVRGMQDVLAAVEAAEADLDRLAESEGTPLSGVRVLAPVVKPRRNVFCVGRNYHDHRAEADAALGKRGGDDYPSFFTKVPETVVGPGAEVRLYADISSQLDWEAELVAVLGRGGRDIPEAEALSYVYGYTCGNDVTMRDVQRRHGNQWFKGKSMDTHAPLGPVLVTADEVGDPQDLEITCRVNGEVKQHASTSLMIFSVARVIHELSRGMRLNPGDVIMTGTPSGVGFARTPPEFLKVGDQVEVEISRIGVLANPVVQG